MQNVDIEQRFDKQIGKLGEKRILRRIDRGKKTNEVFGRRTNKERYGQPTIIVVVKFHRIRWLVHVLRVSESRPTREC